MLLMMACTPSTFPSAIKKPNESTQAEDEVCRQWRDNGVYQPSRADPEASIAEAQLKIVVQRAACPKFPWTGKATP